MDVNITIGKIGTNTIQKTVAISTSVKQVIPKNDILTRIGNSVFSALYNIYPAKFLHNTVNKNNTSNVTVSIAQQRIISYIFPKSTYITSQNENVVSQYAGDYNSDYSNDFSITGEIKSYFEVNPSITNIRQVNVSVGTGLQANKISTATVTKPINAIGGNSQSVNAKVSTNSSVKNVNLTIISNTAVKKHVTRTEFGFNTDTVGNVNITTAKISTATTTKPVVTFVANIVSPAKVNTSTVISGETSSVSIVVNSTKLISNTFIKPTSII